jgi:hypothetical protein
MARFFEALINLEGSNETGAGAAFRWSLFS